MTGIERLHKLIADIDVSADPELWYILRWGTEGGWDCEEHDDKTLGSTLAAIADQIEREQSCDRETTENVRLIVGGVVDDMERHVSGVEGMDDSPVARWSRELREALVGNGRDPAADVSVSAYDLLPEEDREAIAWVREHGGLDAVKRRWECLSYYADPVPRVCMERRLARRQRQIDECHEALRRRNQRIEELGHRVSDLTTENAELRKRAMPESCEWPRYESGELVQIGDEFMGKDGKTYTAKQIQFIGKCFSLFDFCDRKPQFSGFYGERVKRPESKVFDADGAEIREKRDVWWICEGDERGVHAERLRVETICPNGLIECSPHNGGTWVYLEPSELYVNKPVPASDGKPLREGETVWLSERGFKSKLVDRGEPLKVVAFDKNGSVGVLDRDGIALGETSPWWFNPSCLTHERPAPAVLADDGEPLEVGQTVWHVTTGCEYTVRSCTNGGAHLSRNGRPAGYCRADYLTHQRPVLDADGVPIKEGDTVWDVETGIEFEVSKVDGCAVTMSNGCYYSSAFPRYCPSKLTHTKPEPPKRFCRDCAHWQKDPTADKMGVCWFLYHEYEGQDCYSARLGDIGACEEFMPRAKALAERERGE